MAVAMGKRLVAAVGSGCCGGRRGGRGVGASAQAPPTRARASPHLPLASLPAAPPREAIPAALTVVDAVLVAAAAVGTVAAAAAAAAGADANASAGAADGADSTRTASCGACANTALHAVCRV